MSGNISHEALRTMKLDDIKKLQQKNTAASWGIFW